MYYTYTCVKYISNKTTYTFSSNLSFLQKQLFVPYLNKKKVEFYLDLNILLVNLNRYFLFLGYFFSLNIEDLSIQLSEFYLHMNAHAFKSGHPVYYNQSKVLVIIIFS